ncbi:MAG: SDR family NAD(P)-dependent oxidoreductase, partial [Candidatus Hydrogenedentes bacterium]|nr:SDR family NAD(P)-dependent oxidoreductase [Candidatus Hydrogenedentota bacterium]
MKLHRKRAFVTGAASGLGAAICMELAKDGWTIGMCDNRDKPLRAKMKEVDTAGGTALRHVFDVTDRAAYQKGVKTFIHDAGGIDLLVNNAGVAGGGFVGDYLLDDWEWLLNINLMGVVNGCHYFVPYMKEQRFGHVLNVASAAALAPVSRMAAYCTAKAGVRMLSEVLYNELYDYGVGVSVLMPECFRTNLHERTRGQVAETGKWLLEK